MTLEEMLIEKTDCQYCLGQYFSYDRESLENNLCSHCDKGLVPKHPVVVALVREIESLKQRLTALENPNE